MLKIKKTLLVIVSVITLSILGACGFTVEQNEEIGESTTGDAGGTMLAGQEAPEKVGVLKRAKSTEEVFISIDGQDVTFRLSEEAKYQIESNEVDYGREVTFTTYSIGDDKETIDTFINR